MSVESNGSPGAKAPGPGRALPANLVAKATRSDLAFGEEVQELKLLDQGGLCPQVAQLTARPDLAFGRKSRS